MGSTAACAGVFHRLIRDCRTVRRKSAAGICVCVCVCVCGGIKSEIWRERGCLKMKRKDEEGKAKCGSQRGRNLVVSVCASKQLEKADVPASPICFSHPRLSRAPHDQSFLFCFSHHSMTIFLSLSPFRCFCCFFAWILPTADPLLGFSNDHPPPTKLSCGSSTKTKLGPCL